MIFLAWKPEHMLTFLVRVFLFVFVFCTGITLKLDSWKKISGKENSGDAESSKTNLL